jgi:hypothetical protein
MKKIILVVVFALLSASSNSLMAQQADPSAAINESQRDALIEQVSGLLREIYVFPDVAERMVTSINRKNEAGEYDDLSQLRQLTDQITQDFQEISHDRHLSIRPAAAPPANGAGLDDWQKRLAQAKQENFGFRKLEILPGNIGYLELRNFTPAEMGGDTAVAAMNFLANTSAIIFDLRRNGGGDPSMIQLISSYLFEERQHLNSFYIRRSDSTEQYWTQASVSGPKVIETPVYILTSSFTFSAAEEFTYNLKNMERATVVGETTGGGAHPVDFQFLDLGDGLYASISLPFGRAVNPITGTNWEGTGVTPDIEAPASQALEIAQLEILNRLAQNTESDEQRFTIEWARDELTFQLKRGTYPARSAVDYTGSYGPRNIISEGDQLFYQRGDGPRLELEPMESNDRFHVGKLDNFRIQFERDEKGKVVKLTGQYNDGRVDENMRED